MAEVENLTHDAFEQTDEIKALCNEIVQTIREIMMASPVYKCESRHTGEFGVVLIEIVDAMLLFLSQRRRRLDDRESAASDQQPGLPQRARRKSVVERRTRRPRRP